MDPYLFLTDPNLDPTPNPTPFFSDYKGGPKTFGSCGFGSGSPTLVVTIQISKVPYHYKVVSPGRERGA